MISRSLMFVAHNRWTYTQSFIPDTAQSEHDIITTLLTSKQRCINVKTTSCAYTGCIEIWLWKFEMFVIDEFIMCCGCLDCHKCFPYKTWTLQFICMVWLMICNFEIDSNFVAKSCDSTNSISLLYIFVLYISFLCTYYNSLHPIYLSFYVFFTSLIHRHTSIVCYGKEYYFGSTGIDYCPPVSKVVVYAYTFSTKWWNYYLYNVFYLFVWSCLEVPATKLCYDTKRTYQDLPRPKHENWGRIIDFQDSLLLPFVWGKSSLLKNKEYC